MTNEHHDTVVVDDGGSGSGMGAIIGIIAIVVLLIAVCMGSFRLLQIKNRLDLFG